MRKRFKKNYKLILGVIIGVMVSGIVGYAATIISSSSISYDNSKSGLTSTNLKGAIDELNIKATTKIAEAKDECPTGYICSFGEKQLSKKNSNIVKAYSYNSTSCITGEESGCKETNCINYSAVRSCPVGTIIKYKVNSSTTKYFHVLHDDGSTMTLQQRENTISNIAWYLSSKDRSKGPITALASLDSATNGWSNVNSQTYTMGTTKFNGIPYTGCDESGCITNSYTLANRTARARMITVQEAMALGCTKSTKSCPNFMYTTQGSSDYWTMSADSTDTWNAMYVHSFGMVLSCTTIDTIGVRAVVVVNK